MNFLLADDNEDDLLLLEEAIHSVDEAVRVSRALNGRQAIDACSRASGANFDLLVLDYYLPIKTGKDVLLHFSTQQSAQPRHIALLSSHIPADEQAELVASGASAVLEKPFDYDGYLQLARHLIELASR